MELVNYYRIMKRNLRKPSYEQNRIILDKGDVVAIAWDFDAKESFNIYRLLGNGEYVHFRHHYVDMSDHIFTFIPEYKRANYFVEQVFPPEVPVLVR